MSKIKGFINETIVYGFANVFSRVFAMLLIPFYANYLGKIDYSNLVMLQSIFTILTFLLALNSGVFFYYYEFENTKYRKIVFTSWFYYELVLSLFFVFLLFLGSDWVSNLLIVTKTNISDLLICTTLLGIQLVPYVFNNTNINLFRIDRKPKKVMVIVFFEALLTLIFVYIALYVSHFGLIGVFISQIAARTFTVFIFLKTSMFYIKLKHFSAKLLRKLFVFSWPFFVISIFGWIILCMDKFIGAQTLLDKSDVAILSLAMQIVIPIIVLADMIRMAIGPFVMSIYKEADSDKTYQKIFDLSLFAASVVTVLVIAISPLLTLILTNKNYLTVIYVVPLMAFANIFSLASNQFCICFNLVKKNIYILYATVIAGIIGITINYFFMKTLGVITSGISQIFSYFVMGLFLYISGKKVASQNINLKNSFVLIFILMLYVGLVFFESKQIMAGKYFNLILYSVVAIFLMSVIYLKTQKIKLNNLKHYFIN